MIERLLIKNYAIIDTLELEFQDGFSVFSGETGAGKSIIIGALGLVLGVRGDSSQVRSGEEKAVVEAEFSINNTILIEKLKNMNVEEPETLIIRRELFANGKNRIFINSAQETLGKLEEIAENLADLHGQHDHQLLLNQKVHLDILDNFAGLKNDRLNVKNIYEKLLNKIEEKNLLEKDENELNQEKIYWETALKDIEEVEFSTDEEELLNEDMKKMENSEKIHESFHNAYQILYEDEGSVSGSLSKSIHLLEDTSQYDRKYEETLEILQDAATKIAESIHLIAEYRDGLEFDPEALEKTIERLGLIKDLKRKYKVNTIAELIAYSEDCQTRLERFQNRSKDLKEIEDEINKLKHLLMDTALDLSKKRQNGAKKLGLLIKEQLQFLGMEKAEFIVDIKYVKDENGLLQINQTSVKVNENGFDRIEFMITANPGEEPKPLKKVASGGEISRVMLAIKNILSTNDVVDTLIFDEIDVGIGGLTANNVGIKMKDISKNKQLWVITHLPQIAAKADHHFTVSKSVKLDKTFTEVRLLRGEERVVEIARMLGGDSDKGKEHAREMLASPRPPATPLRSAEKG